MTSELETKLRALPEPAPPADLAVAIMSRVAQHDEQAAPTPASRTIPVKTRSNRRASSTWMLGLALALGAQLYRWLLGESTLQLTSPLVGGGLEGMVAMPAASPAVAVLMVGLLLYLVGLFTPFSGAEPHFRSSQAT